MGWLPPSPDGIVMCQKVVLKKPRNGEDGEMKDTMIGVDPLTGS
jgi:transposase